MSFYFDKKKEYEAQAEEALKNKDYAAAFFYTANAADCTFSLAEQCQGKLKQAYLSNANDLVDIAAQLKKKAAEQKQQKAHSGNTPEDAPAAGSGKCLVAEKPNVRLDDVAGMQTVKDQIRLRLIEPLKNPEEARKHGLKVGGGILLYGPPGTGKTFLAKAVAGELDLPFFSITSADVFGKFVGESENNIRNLFREARQNPLSVIFIDELETIFCKRTESIHETTQKVITVILQELDGINDNQNPMMLLGATNTPWMIDEAFLRTGRFDILAYVGLPDIEAREKIIRNSFKDIKYPVEEEAIKYLAEHSEGFSGADLKGIAQKIKQTAFDRKLSNYTLALFEECAAGAVPSCSGEITKNIEQWEKENGIVRK